LEAHFPALEASGIQLFFVEIASVYVLFLGSLSRAARTEVPPVSVNYSATFAPARLYLGRGPVVNYMLPPPLVEGAHVGDMK
jgi:hypothetical protein